MTSLSACHGSWPPLSYATNAGFVLGRGERVAAPSRSWWSRMVARGSALAVYRSETGFGALIVRSKLSLLRWLWRGSSRASGGGVLRQLGPLRAVVGASIRARRLIEAHGRTAGRAL